MASSMRSVGILGGGVCGLYVAWKLACAGFRVILFEAGDGLGMQSSSRLHGWLHSGRFYLLHDVSIAQSCALGYRQIVNLAPASIERRVGAYLVTDDYDRAHKFVKRCEEANLDPNEIPVRDLH